MQDMEILFTDLTIIETDCSCSVICDIMDREVPRDVWMIESDVALSNGQEESGGTVQFWRNKEAILVEYQSGFQDAIVPVDIMFLYNYLTENGWNFVVSDELIERDGLIWSKFFSIIDEENKSELKKEPIDDDNEEDMYGDGDFFEHEQKVKEYKRPTANRYNILSLREFTDHDYDMKKREKNEKETKF